MKPADIVKGTRVTVNPYPFESGTGRRPADTPGKVLRRRGAFIEFEPDNEMGHLLDVYAPQWSRNSFETYRIHVSDIRSVNGVPVEQLAAQSTAV